MRKGPFFFSDSLKAFLPRNAILMARSGAASALDEGGTPHASSPHLSNVSAWNQWRVVPMPGGPIEQGAGQGSVQGQGIYFLADSLSGDKAALNLLHKMIDAIGVRLEEVRIAELLSAEAGESGESKTLGSELFAARPRALVVMGERFGALMGVARGQWGLIEGFPALLTHHPAELVQSPEKKKQAWSDLQELAKTLGIRIPARRG